MTTLSLEQVIKLHERMINTTGGSAGIKDKNLLDSTIHSPFATFEGKELYATIEEKAARLAYSLVNSHCFVDGNKRIGLYVMLIFLELNGICLVFTQENLIDLGLGLADGNISYDDLLYWIQRHK